MILEFKEHVAIITGAARGIGEATAWAFAKRGATSVIVDINAEGAQKVAKEIKDKGFNAVAYTVDVSNEKAVDAIQADSNKANKWAKDYDVKVGNALKSARTQIQAYLKQKPLVGTGKFAEGLIDNAIRQGKELGVDMSKNMSVRRLQNAIQSLEEASKNIDKIQSDAEDAVKKLR